VDLDARRTKYVNVAEEIARQLGMNYVFGREFEELTQGSQRSPAYHGQATPSRRPHRVSNANRRRRKGADGLQHALRKPRQQRSSPGTARRGPAGCCKVCASGATLLAGDLNFDASVAFRTRTTAKPYFRSALGLSSPHTTTRVGCSGAGTQSTGHSYRAQLELPWGEFTTTSMPRIIILSRLR
jgi:hypothetical protein